MTKQKKRKRATYDPETLESAYARDARESAQRTVDNAVSRMLRAGILQDDAPIESVPLEDDERIEHVSGQQRRSVSTYATQPSREDRERLADGAHERISHGCFRKVALPGAD